MVVHASGESVSCAVSQVVGFLLLLFFGQVCFESLISMHLLEPVNVILADVPIDQLRVDLRNGDARILRVILSRFEQLMPE